MVEEIIINIVSIFFFIINLFFTVKLLKKYNRLNHKIYKISGLFLILFFNGYFLSTVDFITVLLFGFEIFGSELTPSFLLTSTYLKLFLWAIAIILLSSFLSELFYPNKKKIFNFISILLLLAALVFSFISYIMNSYLWLIFLIFNLSLWLVIFNKLKNSQNAEINSKVKMLLVFVVIYFIIKPILSIFFFNIFHLIVVSYISIFTFDPISFIIFVAIDLISLIILYKAFTWDKWKENLQNIIPSKESSIQIPVDRKPDKEILDTRRVEQVPLESRRNHKDEKELIEKIKKIVKVSNKIKLDMMRKSLKISEDEFLDKIYDWAERYDFRIDGEYLIINKETISDFIDSLDSQFDEWNKKETREEGKI
ncbi:MAG: hypothetical protein EU549_02615 [Promethearchaeota archaeon]|nr:MAG: hypothetical protein EU549_02615 [Candidatus Lokiarchaeota archaeon]